jgi:hypothetical protein
MKNLSRNDILNVDDLKTEKVEVPEWDGVVWVKTMTGAERDEFDGTLVNVGADGVKRTNLKNYRARLVQVSCVDKDGKMLFSPGDIPALGKKSAAGLDRIFVVAARLNAIGSDELKALEKN